MGIKFANSAFATLAAGINSSVTSITLTTGQGARFPSLAGGDYFFATLIDTSNNLEIVKCTARATDVLTVVRGQESTTARSFATGDRIELRVTAQGLIDASSDKLAIASNLSDLASASTARTNLGLAAIAASGSASDLSSGTVPDARMPSGSVLQTQSLMLTTYTSNGNFSSETDSGYQDVSGYNATITPYATSSKILCIVNTWGSSQRIWYRVLRNGTAIGSGNAISGVNQTAGAYNWNVAGGPIVFMWLDSPNSTSALTYKLQIGGETNITAAFTGAAQSSASQGAGPSNQWPPLNRTMILMEIAG
jgi:hypothetical protein